MGRVTQFRLYPVRPPWALGSGWAAVAGALASGGFALSPTMLLKLLGIWLLADPVLGVMWDLGVDGGIWRRLFGPKLPDAAPPLPLLPYTQPGSPGRRLADRLGRLRLWWFGTFWPQAGREFASLITALGLALLLGLILGRNALALVLLSVALSWITVLGMSGAPAHRPLTFLWRALAEFGIPWLIGALVLGSPSWAVIAFGLCYTLTYFGLIHHAGSFRLIGASQATSALLLAGLRHPLAAAAAAILLVPQWGLCMWAGDQSGHNPAAYRSYLRGVQLFVILSMLVAALAVAS